MQLQEKVVILQKHRYPDVISTLRTLLAQAEQGDVQGILFAVHYTGSRHEMGMVGDYRQDYTTAIGACSLLWRKISDANETPHL